MFELIGPCMHVKFATLRDKHALGTQIYGLEALHVSYLACMGNGSKGLGEFYEDGLRLGESYEDCLELDELFFKLGESYEQLLS